MKPSCYMSIKGHENILQSRWFHTNCLVFINLVIIFSNIDDIRIKQA